MCSCQWRWFVIRCQKKPHLNWYYLCSHCSLLDSFLKAEDNKPGKPDPVYNIILCQKRIVNNSFNTLRKKLLINTGRNRFVFLYFLCCIPGSNLMLMKEITYLLLLSKGKQNAVSFYDK